MRCLRILEQEISFLQLQTRGMHWKSSLFCRHGERSVTTAGSLSLSFQKWGREAQMDWQLVQGHRACQRQSQVLKAPDSHPPRPLTRTPLSARAHLCPDNHVATRGTLSRGLPRLLCFWLVSLKGCCPPSLEFRDPRSPAGPEPRLGVPPPPRPASSPTCRRHG